MYKKSTTGIGARIIEYNGCRDILLHLDNGIEIKSTWKTFDRLDRIKHSVTWQFYIGSEWRLKDGSRCVITSYRKSRDCTVTFDDGVQITTTLDDLRRGQVNR